MGQFFGTHHTRLDAKNRTSVPALFRTALRNGVANAPATLVLRPSHLHACIEAWPLQAFEDLTASMDQLPVFSPEQSDLSITLYADVHPVEADKDGRIILPDSLVQHANLTETITFMGRGRIFEIWEPEAGARRTAEARDRSRIGALTIPARRAAP